MKSISGQRLGKILESKGWTLKSIKGSHHVYVKAGRKERISVPVHGRADLKKGLLIALMKIAGIDETEL